mgnify:CR=1 FL=1
MKITIIMCGKHLRIDKERICYLTIRKRQERERSQIFALNFSTMYYSNISRKITTRKAKLCNAKDKAI